MDESFNSKFVSLVDRKIQDIFYRHFQAFIDDHCDIIIANNVPLYSFLSEEFKRFKKHLECQGVIKTYIINGPYAKNEDWTGDFRGDLLAEFMDKCLNIQIADYIFKHGETDGVNLVLYAGKDKYVGPHFWVKPDMAILNPETWEVSIYGESDEGKLGFNEAESLFANFEDFLDMFA